ncbi:MAG: glycosyltransferase [Butyrivibrio sp.]|nr:glycosyltransferase [Butyrivibrio sp.]
MDNKKSLLLMVPMLHQGGFERVCVATARLMQKYYNVYILIFSSKDINYDVTGLEVIDIDVPAKKGIVNKVFNVFKRVNKVKKIKKDLGIDIAYSFGGSANYVNVLSKGKEKVLTGLRCQTDMENEKQVKLFCSRSDQVLSCSKEIMRQLHSDFKYDKSSYIYNPLDVEDIQKKGAKELSDYPFAEGDLVIASMGRNDYIKGMWHLVKAFSLVHKENPKAKLMVLGAGDWSGYQELADKLGVGGAVFFPGVRKNPFAYVSKADIYVCASNHEGFPNAVLEGMALGKPLISTDCKTGPREILLSEDQYEDLIKRIPDGSSTREPIMGDYGILVPDMSQDVNMDPGVIEDGERILAEKIRWLLSDEARLSEYSKKSLERAAHYSPEKYQSAIHDILRKYE